ncbi:MAG TPA: ABC transporter substrate-binding protein [bacterium]|nr:ABC transporter substrate-binding protein [bacterium]HPQ67322.1 ABC transporter substrate-binding protein [bacterium]
MVRALRRRYAYIVLATAVAAGCGGGEGSRSDYLRLRLSDDPTTLDPAAIVDVPGGSVAAKLYNGLVAFGPDGAVVGDLAEEWSLLPDGRTFRFRLRPGIEFHDGSGLTSADVVYSLTRLLDPEVNSPRSWLLDPVRGAEEFRSGSAAAVSGLRAPDPLTVEIELREPFPVFICYLAMPNSAVIPASFAGKSPGNAPPPGTGPYLLAEWERGNRLVLKANEGYFKGRPGLAGIDYRVIPEDMTAAVEFERGEIDIMEVPRAEFRRYLAGSPWKERVRERSGLNTYYAGFNCTRSPLDDPAVRRALNLALDREKICRTLLEGRAVPAAGPVPPGLLDDPELKGYGYDPDKARRMLKAAGISLPLELELLVKADRETMSIAEVIQDYWKKIGVEARIVQREWTAFKQEVAQGDFDVFYLSWWGDYPSPENFLYPTFFSGNIGSAGNRSRFSDSGTDLLLRAARRQTDPSRALDLYRRAQRRIVDLAPWVFLWHRKTFVITSPRVKGYELPLIYSADKMETVELIIPGG